MTVSEWITAFVALFVIIDPVGLTPVFVALTAGAAQKLRLRLALRAVCVSAGILMVFAFGGEALLAFLGISMGAFRIAGGLLLFLTALEMLFSKRTKRREDQSQEPANDPSVFPLAMPLIDGPGAITTVILLTGQTTGVTEFISVITVLFAVLAVVLMLFSLGSVLERLLGPTGINVVTRLLGMLLAALSVQFVLDGIHQTFGL